MSKSVDSDMLPSVSTELVVWSDGGLLMVKLL